MRASIGNIIRIMYIVSNSDYSIGRYYNKFVVVYDVYDDWDEDVDDNFIYIYNIYVH